MSWDIEKSVFGNIAGMDTRAAWLLNDSQSDYVKNEDYLIPFVVQIEKGVKDDQPSQIVGELVDADLIYVSSWYLTESVSVGNRTIRYPKPGASFVAYAGRRFFELLASDEKSNFFGALDISSLRSAMKSIELRTPLLRAQPDWLSPDNTKRTMALSIKEKQLQLLSPQTTKWSADAVIMAVIDDGIPIANTQFQNHSGTRVEYFWRQDGSTPSPSVPNGTELTRTEINNLLITNEVAGVVDEDSFYRQAGLASFNEAEFAHKSVAWRASHGAHVMDIATGFAKDKNVQNRPIIAVQLPASVVENTSGSELDQHVFDAIEYIFQRAELMAPNRTLPLVINLSFGRYSGPHDGTSALEKYLDAAVNSRDKTRVVLPAGNSRQARCHSVITKKDFIKNQGDVTLNWRVQPDDKSHSYLHVWLPANVNSNPPTSDRVKISVIAPNGDRSSELGEVPTQNDLIYQINNETVCRVSSSFVDNETKRTLFTLSMMPTSRNDNLSSTADAQPIAPAGVWKIVINDKGMAASTEIHSWIERDDTIYGYGSRGRQSYFEDAQYKRYDDRTQPIEFDQPIANCYTKRAGTLNGIATGEKTVVVGAMYRKERKITEYSACGPAHAPFGTNAPTRQGPDLLTIADDSKVHKGIPGAGTRSGSVVYFNGTSVAAPRVAREIANLLAASEQADRNQLAGIVSGLNPLFAPINECSGSGRWELDHPHDPPARIDSENAGVV